jgi:hypothetical protein
MPQVALYPTLILHAETLPGPPTQAIAARRGRSGASRHERACYYNDLNGVCPEHR